MNTNISFKTIILTVIQISTGYHRNNEENLALELFINEIELFAHQSITQFRCSGVLINQLQCNNQLAAELIMIKMSTKQIKQN